MATTIKGDAELRRKLAKLKNLEGLYPVLMAVGVEVYGQASKYAEETAANQEGGAGSRWYERGYGPKWKRSDGTVGGSRTSETLGRRWTMKGQPPLKVIIGNNASYAPYVKDPEKQAAALKRIGWTNTDEDVAKKEKKALEDIKRYIDKLLATG